MPVDDANNPQREEVLARERRKIESDVWLQLRIESVLAEAATIATLPSIVITADDFTKMAREQYDAAQTRFGRFVQQEVVRREFALASPTPPNNEENKT